jgi:hypothetical protein
LNQDTRHHGFLKFVSRIADVPLGYSKTDLIEFRHLAEMDFPGLVPLIEDYIRLAEKSESNADPALPKKAKSQRIPQSGNMHLFDLLREKHLFASNTDLAEFAARILPKMKQNRFHKMARGDIAARIIEYLDTRDPRTRAELEKSMRDAMSSATKPAERRDFFSKWEKIIKGIPL